MRVDAGQMIGCVASGKPDPGRSWSNIWAYDEADVIHARLRDAMTWKRMGYEHALFRTNEGRLIDIPLHKLEDI